MEAAEETLTYPDDTGLHRKLLPEKEEKKDTESEATKSDLSNYVDLDMKTVKVTFTGQGGHLSVIRCDSPTQGAGDEQTPGDPGETLTKPPCNDRGSESDKQPEPEPEPSDRSDRDELQYTDMYLNSRTESDDGASAVASDHCGSDAVEDESHYITTHEIQLTELDHDVDYDLGRGTCWEFEDDNLVYSFVDYASFEGDDAQEGPLAQEGRGPPRAQSNLGGAVVSAERDDEEEEEEESDLGDSDKCASSDESACQNRGGDASEGQIHLSIKASSRAVHAPAGVPASTACGCAGHFGDGGGGGRVSLVGPGARAGPLGERPQYFIPAPGRQHLATKLRRKDINEYSSGASSSISELDDADKEVRNLTARSFRSLACPYFDAINLSTSSESSMSEYGLNKWSAYVDWKCGDASRGRGRGVVAHKTSSARLEMSRSAHDKRLKAPQTKAHGANKRATCQQARSPKQGGVTLNLRCDAEAPDGSRRPRCSIDSQSSELSDRPGAENTGETHKRATFASSLLKNVISKKMQFEEERKMERSRGRGVQRQTSESGSGLSGGSTDDPGLEGSGGPAEEQKTSRTLEESERGQNEQPKASDESEPAKEAEPTAASDPQPTAREAADPGRPLLTKLLFVPSCQQKFEKESRTSSNGKTPGKDAVEKQGWPRPEIKIRLRSVKENKGCTLNIASLLTPKISYSAVDTFRSAGDAKYHVLSTADKVPNFSVRDIRDTKCRFQTPIYHVRDVRKLVKSSYRFVSLDNRDNKCPTAADKVDDKHKTGPVKHLLPSPIVIKCHSVKTDVKSGTAGANDPCEMVQGRVPPVVSKQPQAEQLEIPPQPETKVSKQRQDRLEPAMPKQAAIEKLKAAVKTMEQLYVFDRNEWKRKAQAPQPVAGSHVLSLIAREEQGAEQPEATNTDRTHATETDNPQVGRDGAVSLLHVPRAAAAFKTQTQQSKTFTNRSVLNFGDGRKAHVSISSVSNAGPQDPVPPTTKSSSAQIEPKKQVQAEQAKVRVANPTVTQGCPDSENYLTIPGTVGYTSEIKVVNKDPASREEGFDISRAHAGGRKTPEQKRSPLIIEYPATSVRHHPAALATTAGPQTRQQVLCISPSHPSVTPPTPNRETVPQTQRKMLLDPATGHYYLVDTPVQPTTKRLFDPETGQYVDVPMPHSPVGPVTPVPLSLSPVTLTPGAYAPTYMIYPSFVPSPTLPAQVVVPPSPCHFEDAGGGDKSKGARSPRLETNTTGGERAYYSATGGAPQAAPPLPVGHVAPRGGGASAEKKPVISITTQQGPRIIAPPSFDGTTMSFVVEHR